MDEIAILLMVATVVIVIIVSFCYVMDYACQNSGDEVISLSFKEFFKYYQLCPEHWSVSKICLRKHGNQSTTYYCRIKFTSYWRYLLFYWELKRMRKLKQNNKAYIQFLQDTQQGIDECKAKAKKYMDEGIDILNKM